MTDELTERDKAILLGNVDRRNVENEYDRDFYEAMHQTHPLNLDEIDDLVRRAVLRYMADGQNETVKANGGWVMMGFFHGYMVGRKLRKDIRRR